MRQISLKDKLVVSFVIIGIAGIIIVQSISYYFSREALLDRTFEQLTSVRAYKKHQLETFFKDRMIELKQVSVSDESQEITSLLSYTNKKTTAEELRQKLSKYMLEALANSGYYKRLLYIGNSLNAFVVYPNREKPDSLFKLNIKSNPVWQNILQNSYDANAVLVHDLVPLDDSDIPSILVTAPLGSNPNCIVCLEVSYDAVNNIMIESSTENGLGLSGETYLVGFDSLMRSQSRFSEHSVLLTKVKTFGVEQSLSGITGISIFEDYRGIKVLSSYGSLNIPNLNWVILAEIDISEAMAPVYNLRNNTLFIGIVIACLIFVFAYFFSERLTSPIRDLSKATLRIGNGEFRQSLPIQSNDEVGELTEGFNKMAGQLQQQQDELAQERQKTLRSMIDGQEQERQRLSRELHDGLGQSFIAIKLQLESFCDEIEGEKKEKLNKLKDYFEITIEDIRRMSNDLAPSVLKEFGLMTALRNLCRLFSEQSNIEIIYNSTGKIPKLTSKAQTYLYRIAQEALNNAVKHSEATEILVTLDGRADEVRLIIQDNGSGFDTNNVEASGGNGIQNMRERAYLLPGKIDINSVVNAGTTIEVKCSA